MLPKRRCLGLARGMPLLDARLINHRQSALEGTQNPSGTSKPARHFLLRASEVEMGVLKKRQCMPLFGCKGLSKSELEALQLG